MQNAKVTQHRYEETKRIIDFIYTTTSNGRTHGAWRGEAYTVRCIVTILLKRGVLIYVGKSRKRGVSYQWNQGAMAPTENFYKTIAQDVANYTKNYHPGKKDQSIKPTLTEGAVAVKSKIVDFTAQELWNELKRRGYAIEDEKLVCRTYLD